MDQGSNSGDDSDFFDDLNGYGSDTASEVTVTSANVDGSRPGSRTGSKKSLDSISVVAVGNLIDLGSDSGSDHQRPLAKETMSEQSFEGVANGYMSGGSGSGVLLDAPLDPMRATTSTTPITPGTPSFVHGHRKIPSASSTGKQLFSQGQNGLGTSNYSGGSRRSSFNSDVENMSVSDAELHSEITEISAQVQRIQQQLTSMEENHLVTDDKHIRLKQDNAVLQERLHSMEELLQQTEERWRDKYREEKHRAKDIVHRLEREKALELESWTLKHQMLEKEMAQCRAEREKLAEEAEKMRMESLDIRESADDVQFRLRQLEQERADLNRELRKQKEEAQTEIRRHAEHLADVTRENEELRAQKGRPRGLSIAEKATDLAEELARLREEHRRVLGVNEELHAELLQVHVQQGRSLLAASDGPSLASEMHGKDKDELINALKDQEVCNQKLRIYIDGILTRVIEKYPEILEIKS